VFVAHAGFLLTGGGHIEDECSSSRNGGCNGTFSFDTRDKSPVVLGVSKLNVPLQPPLREELHSSSM